MLSLYAQQTMVDAMPVGACILGGLNHTINAANEQMLAIWGKDSTVIGKDIQLAIPEIYDQSFFDMLKTIYVGGEAYHNFNGKAKLIINEQPQTIHLDYSFKPLRDRQGKIYGIVNTAVNVTKVVRAQQKLSQINKVLVATNAELITLNQQNTALNLEQKATHEQLIKSEQRLRSVFEQAPLALCVLSGPQHLIKLANERVFKLWGKSLTVLGQPYVNTDIKAASAPALQILDNVYRSGIAATGHEVKADTSSENGSHASYFDYIYQPIQNEQGETTGILTIIQDVTERVETRNKGMQATQQLELAVQAAKIGTWNLHPQTNALIYNVMLAEIYGYEAAEPMTYEQVIGQVTEEYHEVINQEIEKAIASDGNYDIIYQQRRFNDGKVIWLHSIGKVNQAESASGILFSGVVMDITQLKQDEQRKNDFISMVSHELKTPLTSMSGYLQILALNTKKLDDHIAVGMLNKAHRQMQRMTTLINGFLNVSRLESGQIYIDRSRFDMAGLIKEIQEEVSSSHQFIFEPVACTMVTADRDKIGQVINNFITNAVKYSPVGSTIYLSCVTDNGMARISVKDEGMGIAPKDKAHLFDRFYRVEAEQTKSISGFGIGLYLCAEIIRRHEGQIGVDSEQGQGSTFWFTLASSEK